MFLRWQPMETVESLGLYRHALQQSDLTLSPVGINTECYRIYEAAAYGSVPVVEDVMTPGYCGTNNNNSSNVSPIPLHLLKASNAPFIFLTDWRELPKILQHELALSMRQKVQRRVRLVRWYHDFLAHLRKNFTKIIRETFFPRTNVNCSHYYQCILYFLMDLWMLWENQQLELSICHHLSSLYSFDFQAK